MSAGRKVERTVISAALLFGMPGTRRDAREQVGDHSWPSHTAGRAYPMAGVNGIPHDGNEVAEVEEENAECGR